MKRSLYNVSELQNDLKEFREQYLVKMQEARDSFRHKNEHRFDSDKGLEQKYDELWKKCRFLEAMTTRTEILCTEMAVLLEGVDNVLRDIGKYKIIENGEVRATLITKQRDVLGDGLKKLKNILDEYSTT